MEAALLALEVDEPTSEAGVLLDFEADRSLPSDILESAATRPTFAPEVEMVLFDFETEEPITVPICEALSSGETSSIKFTTACLELDHPSLGYGLLQL